MTKAPATDDELDQLEGRIDAWLADWQAAQASSPAHDEPLDGSSGGSSDDDRPLLLDTQRDEEVARRWYVRLAGETRDVIAIWLTLRQRTLAYETYVLPLPPGDRAAVAYDFALRRNYRTVGAQYAIGPEEGLYLKGELATASVDEDELDRIVGSLWMYVERDFATLLRLCFDARPGG